MRRRRSRSLALLTLAGAACATTGEAPSAGAPSFEGSTTFALVRWVEGEGQRRPPDPLDALAASLAERGLDARFIEIGPRAPEGLLDVERLYARAEARVGSPLRSSPVGPARTEGLGAEAGEVVRKLGVDAVVMFHRFEAPLLPPLPDSRRLADPFNRRQLPYPEAPPLGAFTLVDRHGEALSLEWGRPGAEFEPTALVNAAEAVEAVLRILSGEPLED